MQVKDCLTFGMQRTAPPPLPSPLLMLSQSSGPTRCRQDIRPFESPDVNLEQYPTGAELASRLLFTVIAPALHPAMHRDLRVRHRRAGLAATDD